MKKRFILVLSMLLLLVGCSKGTEPYQESARELVDDMLELAAEAEVVVNDYSKIWSFSIESGTAIAVKDVASKMDLSEEEVREHFDLNPLGNVTGDFSSNVNSLNLYYMSNGKLKNIENTLDNIKERTVECNKSIINDEKLSDEILNIYSYLNSYVEMALNPSGTLQTFNENKNQLAGNILEAYNKIEILIPTED